MALWSFKSCCRCRGDLVLEEGQWRCYQCGHYYYTDLFQPVEHLSDPDCVSSNGRGRGRNRCGGIADRNINQVVKKHRAKEKRWWERNRQIVAYLDEGRTVHEIAALTARPLRQVRLAREILADCREQAEGLSS